MPIPKYNPDLIATAKENRKNMTPHERTLWFDFLRGYPLRFVRQKVLGMYIVDFYCARAKLVLELDGGQHYEPSCMMHDAIRTEFLKTYGLTVLRIPNNAITENFEGVCEYIDTFIRASVQ